MLLKSITFASFYDLFYKISHEKPVKVYISSSSSSLQLLKNLFAELGNVELFFIPKFVNSSITIVYLAQQKTVHNTSFLT